MRRKDLETITAENVDTQVSIFTNNQEEHCVTIVRGSTEKIVNALINLNINTLGKIHFLEETDRTDAVACVCRELIKAFAIKPEDIEEPEIGKEDLKDIGAKLIKSIEEIINRGDK